MYFYYTCSKRDSPLMRLCALKNADTRKYFSVLTKNGKEQAYKIKRLRHLIANQGHYLAQLLSYLQEAN